MRFLPCITLVAMCLSSSYGNDINVTEYVYGAKGILQSWNRFFTNRTLLTELLTINAAGEAVNSMSSNMNGSLSAVVVFQRQELSTAQEMMAGTSAEGCVDGIANYMHNAINDAMDGYNDCTADAFSKLTRLKNYWIKLNNTNDAGLRRALIGINACQTNYPNRDSYDRLKSCVQSMMNNYMRMANDTIKILSPSPSMTYINQTVIACASEAARLVTNAGYNFLQMLGDCAQLCKDIDQEAYKKQLSTWKGYNDTLAEQIMASQRRNSEEIQDIEMNILLYIGVSKSVCEDFIVEPRGYPFYLNFMFRNLNNYYNTVLFTSLDNPGDLSCAATARKALDIVAQTYANKALMCDNQVVNNTKSLMSNIHSNFALLNNLMPLAGNVPILRAIVDGYIFAPNTIKQFTDLTNTQFKIVKEELETSTTNDVNTLRNYLDYFYNYKGLPCGNSFRQNFMLEAEKALYNMQRCLYISSGTTYSVTTTALDSTSTTAIAFTTSENSTFN